MCYCKNNDFEVKCLKSAEKLFDYSAVRHDSDIILRLQHSMKPQTPYLGDKFDYL